MNAIGFFYLYVYRLLRIEGKQTKIRTFFKQKIIVLDIKAPEEELIKYLLKTLLICIHKYTNILLAFTNKKKKK